MKGQTEPSLRDCSFAVEPGELILFTGESGCGKTTIIKLINGLLQHVGRRDFGRRRHSGRPGCGRDAPVGAGTDRGLRVSESQVSVLQSGHHRRGCSLVWRARGLSGGNVPVLDSAVQICGVGPLLDRNIFALSGGEKQRIACASAWAMGPEVFVLDEPSSNLDGEGIHQLRDILRRLKAAGKTVLVAEHRLWYAADLADRVFYLREGQLERIYTGGVPGFAGRETALHGSAGV